MNRFMTFGIASTLAVLSIAGATSAASMHPTATSGSGSASAMHLAAYAGRSDAHTDRIIRHWQGGRFDIVPVGTLDDTAVRASIVNHAQTEPRQVARLQSAIERNHALSSRLSAQNVEIGNIVDAQTALDGGITFYVR